MLPPGLNAFRENSPRRHDLDEVGAVLEIGPNRFRDFFRTVGEIFDHWHIDINGKLFRIARTAGGGNIIASHEQSRPRHRAFIDRVSQIDIDVRPSRSHVAASGEASAQGDKRVARAPKRIVTGCGFRERIFPVHAHAARQMGVQIDQAGEQSRITQIDHGRARGHGKISADANNLFAFHSNHRRSQRRAAASIEQTSRFDNGDRRDGWLAGCQCATPFR